MPATPAICTRRQPGIRNPPSVLHPLRTDITAHILPLPDGLLQALTPEGLRHLETLHLNRPPLVERRKMRRLIQALLEQETQRLEREKQLDTELRTKKRAIRRKKRP